MKQDATSHHADAISHGTTITLNFGVYLAILPAHPSILPNVLRDACESTPLPPLANLTLPTHAVHDASVLSASFESGRIVSWTHSRTAELFHPQLRDPLKFLEISCHLRLIRRKDDSASSSTTTTTADDAEDDAAAAADDAEDRAVEEICRAYAEHITSVRSDVVGNVEVLLVLRDTPVPILSTDLPFVTILTEGEGEETEVEGGVGKGRGVDGDGGGGGSDDGDGIAAHSPTIEAAAAASTTEVAASIFDEYGLVGLRRVIGTDDLSDLTDLAQREFDVLHSALLEAQRSGDGSWKNVALKDGKLHFREIMQRDEGRFDYRLDCDAYGSLPSENKGEKIDADGGGGEEDGAGGGRDGKPSWKRLGAGGGWVPTVARILGGTAVHIRSGCVLSLPGTGVQYWHSDGVHVAAGVAPGFGLTDGEDNVEAETAESEEAKAAEAAAAATAVTTRATSAHAVCVFVPLIDLTERTGYTEFWAGSHKYDKLLQKKGEQSLPGGTKGILSKGECLIYDYRTIHRGMPNNSDWRRPVCYFLYTKPGYEFAEEQNFTDRSVFDLSPPQL